MSTHDDHGHAGESPCKRIEPFIFFFGAIGMVGFMALLVVCEAFSRHY